MDQTRIEKLREALALTNERNAARERKLANLIYIASAIALLGVAGVAINKSSIFINVTSSMPVGFYKKHALPGTITPGMTVLLCPPSPAASPAIRQAIKDNWLIKSNNTPCKDHLVPFLKNIAAVPGQKISIKMSGIYVDGSKLSKTKIQPVAKNGKKIVHYPLGTYTVQPGHVWLWDNSSKWAYDSRYWGPIPVGNLVASARPVLTW